ncbi:MAG: cysteine--tRNA ligase [Actinobacteria bacterium]|nr:cysteine--tRNA ligase [Actinomycetota bacterium]
MNQRIYDTRRQDVVDFDPRVPGEVGMYVCGPTVQSAPHIGHLRSALVYDQFRRWLRASGHRVTLIRNVTDIDDKILDNARLAQQAGGAEPWWGLAYRVEREFTAAYDALGILPPTYEPRATANIAQMVELIERLIERGHAYQAEDGTASVYFDTASWPAYGELTRQRREQMEDAADSEPLGKRDPRDFALWKAYRAHEPESASWPSPWGRGRPGWHIECSAMATRYLGEEFDIHGGGLDLRFPHHENELAQSAAAGHGFARYWLHNGLVNTGGQKMSKSLGNSLFAHDLLSQARPIVLRYFLGSAHYRSVLEFSETSLGEAAAAFGRIEGFVARASEFLAGGTEDRVAGEYDAALRLAPLGGAVSVEMLPRGFVSAMLDDFGVPQALGVLHDTVRAGNSSIDSGDAEGVLARAAEVVAMLDVLGLDSRDPMWISDQGSAGGEGAAEALGALVSALIDERRAARAAKDFLASDAIRDRLQAAGIALEDGQNETRWSVA